MRPAANRPRPRRPGSASGALAVGLSTLLLATLLLVQHRGGMLGSSALAGRLRSASINPVEVVGAEEYFGRVRDAIERIPYIVGPYIGADSEPTAAAIKLLRPNKILQRRYKDPATRKTVDLLIVHCADVRDMQGHYPPVCYPAHGWVGKAAEPSQMPIEGTLFPATYYRFHRSVDQVEQRLRIVNFFILPDGRLLADDRDLEAVSKSRASAGLGSAQVQLIFGDNVTEEERADLATQFGRAIAPVVREIGSGVGR